MPDTNVSRMHTGRRKEAAARVLLVPGTGKITINGRAVEEYFHRPTHYLIVRQPLVLVSLADQLDVEATVRGGGETGQAGAVRHGIARALVERDPELRVSVKQAGYLPRDPRTKERKKYGQPGARKRFQYSKR